MSDPIDEGLEAHQALMHSGVSHDKRSMEIGWFGRIVKARNEFARHGCRDEKEYRELVRIGRTTWYRMIRIAGALSQLKREEFLSMTVENADLLSRIPDEERYDPELLEMARTLNEPQFQKRLLERRAKLENKPVEEVRVGMRISLFEGQRTVVEDALTRFMRQHGIVDRGTALEWIMMEYRDSATIMAFLQQSAPTLRKALKAESLEEIRGVVAGYVMAMLQHLEQVKGKKR